MNDDELLNRALTQQDASFPGGSMLRFGGVPPGLQAQIPAGQTPAGSSEYRQWQVTPNDTFRATGPTVTSLPAGVYAGGFDPYGPYVERRTVLCDDLIEFRWIEYFRPSLKARGPSSLTWSAKKVDLNSLSKSEIAQGRVIVGTATKRPVVAALALRDREIVDAGNPQPHQAVLVELPILVALAAKPIAAVVVPLIGETNRDTILAEGPDFLNQPVVEFTLPFPGQERFDRRAAL